MRSNLQAIDRMPHQADTCPLAVLLDTTESLSQNQMSSAPPLNHCIAQVNSSLAGVAVLLREQAQHVDLVSTSIDQISALSDILASELAKNCAESLVAYGQFERSSRLATEADCISLVGSADIVRLMRNVRQMCVEALSVAVKAPSSSSVASIEDLQARLIALVAALGEIQPAVQEALGLAEVFEQSIVTSAEHSGEARLYQRTIGLLAISLNEAVQPLGQIATSCAHLKAGYLSVRMQANVVSQQLDSVVGQLDAVTNISTMRGGNLLQPEQALVISHIATLARLAAKEVGSALATAAQAGLISIDALFDELYYPVEGSKPLQYVSAKTDFLRATMPEFLNPLFADTPWIAGGGLIDRNGYQPIWISAGICPLPHPTKMIGWQNAESGFILEDNARADAARSISPSLVLHVDPHQVETPIQQRYEMFSPVIISGRHWGSLRIGFVMESSGNEPNW